MHIPSMTPASPDHSPHTPNPPDPLLPLPIQNPPPPHVSLGNSEYPYVIINNTGYIQTRDLENELNQLINNVSPTTRDTILESIPIKYARESNITDLNLNPDDKFIPLVRIEDANQSINLHKQFNLRNHGLHIFYSQTGIINITHKNTTLATPYIILQDIRYIPINNASRLGIPKYDEITPLVMTGWDKTQLLLQHQRMSPSSYPPIIPPTLQVISLNSLSKIAGSYFKVQEFHL